jgi:predicted dehydrogenase
MSERRKGISRRRFLARAASAVAAPYVLISGALGQAARRARRKRPAASDRIGIGFIGVGRRGASLASSFLYLREAEVLAVCDVDQKRRERTALRLARRSPNLKTSKDYREVLGRKDVDAVVIATPDHWHAIMAIEAARAGKDIYCESPISLTVREARAVVAAARRYGRVFQMGAQSRSYAACRQACELVRSGRIGQVKTVHVQAGAPSRDCNLPGEAVPEGFDWDLWLGPAPRAPYNRQRCGVAGSGWGWWQWRDYSGGYMTYHGAHRIDLVQWGLGMDAGGPVEIVPPDAKARKPLTYRYANGVEVYNARGPNKVDVEFTGPNGSIGTWPGGMKTWPEELGKQPPGAGDVQLYRSDNHVGNFLECIKTRRRCVSDAEVGCRTATVCHLGNIATWLGRPLKWDPVKERFVGDAEADRWLARPKRAPWHL